MRHSASGGHPDRGSARVATWLRLFGFLFVVFVVPAVLLRAWPDPETEWSPLGELRSQRPEIVFIGNSMLETRINPDHLSEVLDDRPVASLAVQGSQSAVWYLQLKHLVENVDPLPTTVFVFFRNDLITRPLAPLDARNRELVEVLRTSDDPEFDYVLEHNRSFHGRLAHLAEQAYPIAHIGDIPATAPGKIAAALVPGSHAELAENAQDRFAFHNLREPDIDRPAVEVERSFADSVDDSFLPMLIDLASSNGIEIVFVMVQPRPNEDGTVLQTGSMTRYRADIAAYLAARQIGFIDPTGNPDIDPAMYYDSFHIRQRYLDTYTELFREIAEPHLQGPANGTSATRTGGSE